MESMRVVSVNLGRAEEISHGNRSMVTGINKKGTDERVWIGELGLKDDAICDGEHHGGVDQAVYAYSAEDYDWWSQQLGRPIRHGTFGENLTISGLPDDMNAGERLLIGDVVLEATSPRIPCSTLATQMQDNNFGLQFRRAEKPGFYFRVLNEGDVGVGDSVTFVENPDSSVSMLELFRANYEIHPAADALERYIEAPIAERMREKFGKRMGAAESG